jgi:Na+/melibiose symporter-like transporter
LFYKSYVSYLSFVDYKNGICAEDQNKNVGIVIKYLLTILPLACILLGSVFAFLYPIDEERAKANSIKLKEYHLKTESQASL